MRTTVYERVRLIRTLQAALNNGFAEDEKAVIARMIAEIRSDARHDQLAPSKDKEGYVAYTVKPWNPFDNSTRVRTTFRRYVRRQMGVDTNTLSDKALEELGRLVSRGTLCEECIACRIRICQGEEIVNWYGKGIAGSCMTGSNAWKVELLAKNPDKVRLVILDESVRALLWTCDDGMVVLDRVYPSDCDGVVLLQEWAAARGYAYRESDKYCPGQVLLSDGKIHQVTLRKAVNVYPCLDTFAYGRISGDRIVVSNDEAFGEITFHATNGLHCGLRPCKACGLPLLQSEVYMATDEAYCEGCYRAHFFTCAECHSTEHMNNQIRVNSTRYCWLCAEKLFVKCFRCGGYFPDDQLLTVKIEGDSVRLCSQCRPQYAQCQTCGNHFCTEYTVNWDGVVRCLDCAEPVVARCQPPRAAA